MELTVISGKGGTGKSNITAALAGLNKNIVLADCDVDTANQYLIFNPDITDQEPFTGSEVAVIDNDKCINCGLCFARCRFGAIKIEDGQTRVSEVFCDGCEFCKIICPEQAITMMKQDNSRVITADFRYGKLVYGMLAPGEENSGKLVNIVKAKARNLARKNDIEHIIVDGPPGIGCPVISSISGSDAVLIVTEPSLSALHDLIRTIELLKNYSMSKWILINKYDLNEEIANKMINLCYVQDISLAGMVPFDEQIVKAMINCKTLTEFNPDANSVKAIQSVYDCIFKPNYIIKKQQEL